MKPSIQLNLHQQLSLTPQLQQAIRLLQLSQLELVTELRQITEANPLLELVDDGAPEAAAETGPESDEATIADDAETAWDADPGAADAALDFSRANTSSHAGAADLEPQNT